jgi:hypothetical protein
MAIICGIIWGVIRNFLPFFYLNLLIGPGIGYAIGEIVGLSVNRKRGKGLATMAGIAVPISYLFSLWFVSLLFGIPFGWELRFSPLNIVFDLVAIALGIWIAVMRLR